MSSGSLFRTLTLAALMVLVSASALNAQFTGAYKRMKLLEQFTSATCPPCAQAAPYVEAVVKLENDIISVRYHMNYPSPGDPWNVMNGTHPQVRHDLYGISGIPYMRVGGTMNINPTAGIAAINNLVSQIPPTSMAKVEVKQVGGNIEVTVTTDRALSGAHLFFSTIQRSVTISNLPSTLPNSNGERTFGDIMMFMYPDAAGTAINQAAGETKKYTFTPGVGSDLTWNKANLYGIAFIQDDATLEIIQAGASVTNDTPKAFDYFEGSKATANISGIYERVDRGATATKAISLTNSGSTPVTVDLTVTNAEALAQIGMAAEIKPSTITIPANGSASTELTVTGPDRSVFVSIGSSLAASDGLGGMVPNVFYLVNGAKVVNYYGLGNEGAPLTQIAAQSSAKYLKDVVYMPYSTEILTNYPSTEFDAAIFAFDAYWLNLRGSALTSVEDLLKAKKGVWIQSQAGMYAAFERYLTNAAFDATRVWYRTVAGIELSKFEFRANFDANGNPTSLIQFPVKGITGDPIGGGLTFTANAATQDFPYYALGTDVIKLTSSSKAKPVLYYDNNQNNIAMVRVEPTYGGRLVYGSVGSEIIASTTTRNTLTEKVVDWLLGTDAAVPKIAVSQGTLNYGAVEVDQTKELSFTLTNTGNAELSITDYTLTGADAISFDITGGGIVNGVPIKVAAGGTHVVKVTFAPTSKKTIFGAALAFVSNAADAPTVQLRGSSTVTSVETDVVSETGAIGLTLVGANPIADNSAVRLTSTGSVTVTVVDAAGRTVSTLFDGTVNGSETVAIASSTLTSGTYSIVATNGSDRAVLTVVVVR